MFNNILLDGSQNEFEIMHLFWISKHVPNIFRWLWQKKNTPNFHKGQYQFTYLSILVIPSRLAAKCENLVITHLLFTCQNSWAFFCPTIFFAVNHCLDFFLPRPRFHLTHDHQNSFKFTKKYWQLSLDPSTNCQFRFYNFFCIKDNNNK